VLSSVTGQGVEDLVEALASKIFDTVRSSSEDSL
jgi:hypothetical protein